MMPIVTDGIDLTRIRRQVTVVESKLCLKISPIPSAPTSKTFLRKGKGQLEYVELRTVAIMYLLFTVTVSVFSDSDTFVESTVPFVFDVGMSTSATRPDTGTFQI